MKLQLTGKGDRSQGCECVLFGLVEGDGHFTPAAADALNDGGRGRAGALNASGSWRLRAMSPGGGFRPVTAVFADKAEEDDLCEMSERAILLSHDWSGIVRVADAHRTYEFDLHSQNTRLLLLDFTHELAVDVSRLAIDEGGLQFPRLTLERILEHVVESGAWFAFLSPIPSDAAGPLAKYRAWRRRSARTTARVRILSLLLPALVSRAASAQPQAYAGSGAPANGQDVHALQDRLRLVAAAVDGVTRRLASPA